MGPSSIAILVCQSVIAFRISGNIEVLGPQPLLLHRLNCNYVVVTEGPKVLGVVALLQAFDM